MQFIFEMLKNEKKSIWLNWNLQQEKHIGTPKENYVPDLLKQGYLTKVVPSFYVNLKDAAKSDS